MPPEPMASKPDPVEMSAEAPASQAAVDDVFAQDDADPFDSPDLAVARDAIQANGDADLGRLVDVVSDEHVDEALASGPVDAGIAGLRFRKPGKVQLKGIRTGPSLFEIWVRKLLKVAAPVGVVVGFVVLIAAIPQRDAVVRMIPDLAPLYALVGLDVNVRGVEFSQFTAERSTVAGVALLRIEGAMTNLEGADVPLSPLRLALLSDTGSELFVWRIEPDAIGLMPGQSLPISSELTAPPESVASVAVRFLQDGEQLPGEAM
ncbi:MAG: hypothetical protein AB8B88_07265 [Devosiaceae bacterium]